MTMRRVKLLCTALMLLASHGALAVSYPLPPEGSRLVGSAFTIAVPDNNTQPLESFAAQYGQGLSNMLEANPGVDVYLPRSGSTLTIPQQLILPDTVREGIVINVAEMRLYYYPPLGNSVEVLPIGIGQAGRETPRNWVTAVERKQEGPTWVPTANTRREYAKEGKTLPAMVPPGPDNPMGLYAIYIGRLYAIHGTNANFGIGLRVSQETSTDPETGETTTEEVPYEYYILNVTLTNKTLPAVILPRLNEQQREIYTVMQQLKGNKPYLWEGIYNGGEDTGPSYEIPGEALDDPAFAALMEEATKYIGWPYVWGGSSPSTSFDCSGFVCWVYTASGVHNLPRTTAQGIYNQCAIISPSEAKPGDIIFFTGTYDSPGPVSHVGIYVGDGMMLHCGSPIQYANINSSYWQTHFYAFGRL